MKRDHRKRERWGQQLGSLPGRFLLTAFALASCVIGCDAESTRLRLRHGVIAIVASLVVWCARKVALYMWGDDDEAPDVLGAEEWEHKLKQSARNTKIGVVLGATIVVLGVGWIAWRLAVR